VLKATKSKIINYEEECDGLGIAEKMPDNNGTSIRWQKLEGKKITHLVNLPCGWE